jgi:hypothetical protein
MRMEMDQIEFAKPRRRAGRGRPFVRGRSGNPAGWPAEARNRKTLAEEILLDGEAEALTRKMLELALAGDPWTFSPEAGPVGALRLCLERTLPPCRERAAKFALPPIESAADIAAAMTAVAAPWRRPHHLRRRGSHCPDPRHLCAR